MHNSLLPVAAGGSSGCPTYPSCSHWIWNHGWPRCATCPSTASNDNEIFFCERRIDVPPPALLLECRTRFAMSLAYAALPASIVAPGLGDFVEAVIDESDAIVIDHDGVPFDFHRMDIAAMLSCLEWNSRFLKARLTCVWIDEEPIISARIKLLWITLALLDPAAAHDTLM